MSEQPDPAAPADLSESDTRSGLDRIVANSAKIFSWGIFIAFAISVYEVFARYVFDSPTMWVHETTTFLIAATFLIGGPVALARNKHIRVRMVYDTVSPATRRWLDIVNSIIAMIFFAGLGFSGWTLAWKATHTPTGAIHFEGTGTAWNPPTPALLKIIILICVVLMLVQTAIHLVKAIRRDVTEQTDGDH